MFNLLGDPLLYYQICSSFEMHAMYIRNEVAADEEAGGRREEGELGAEEGGA